MPRQPANRSGQPANGSSQPATGAPPVPDAPPVPGAPPVSDARPAGSGSGSETIGALPPSTPEEAVRDLKRKYEALNRTYDGMRAEVDRLGEDNEGFRQDIIRIGDELREHSETVLTLAVERDHAVRDLDEYKSHAAEFEKYLRLVRSAIDSPQGMNVFLDRRLRAEVSACEQAESELERANSALQGYMQLGQTPEEANTALETLRRDCEALRRKVAEYERLVGGYQSALGAAREEIEGYEGHPARGV